MARSIFTFEDDSEYAGGGFQDAPDWVEPDLSEEEDPKQPEPDGDANKTDSGEGGPKPETDKKPAPELDEPAEPKPDPIEAFRAEQKQQFDFFRDQVARLNKELLDTRSKLEEATRPNVPPPSEEDWAQNPNEAARRLVEAERQKWEMERRQAEAAALQESHQKSVNKIFEKAPAIRNNAELQAEINREFYSDPNLQADPDGPFMAAQRVAAREIARTRQNRTPQAAPSAVNSKEAEERAAKAERERAAKVKKNAMHASGKGGQAKVTTVDPQLAALARQHGVSIDTLKAMEGIK
jgi:hypothetical protein